MEILIGRGIKSRATRKGDRLKDFVEAILERLGIIDETQFHLNPGSLQILGIN